ATPAAIITYRANTENRKTARRVVERICLLVRVFIAWSPTARYWLSSFRASAALRAFSFRASASASVSLRADFAGFVLFEPSATGGALAGVLSTGLATSGCGMG